MCASGVHFRRPPFRTLELSTMAESHTKDEKDWEKTSDDQETFESTTNDDEPMPVDLRIRRKVDLHLIPLVAVLYLCSFLWVGAPFLSTARQKTLS